MPTPITDLCAENAYIWRITHVKNLPWILDNGLHCASSAMQDPNFVVIGNTDLISKRNSREVPIHPGGYLQDYIPFYFTPFSPMLYNIITGRGVKQRGNDEICILVSKLTHLSARGVPFIFTNMHAYPPYSKYFNSLNDLDQIDWALLQSRNFSRDSEDPLKFERYQAEALVHRQVSLPGNFRLICSSQSVKDYLDEEIQQRQLTIRVDIRTRWFF